MSQTESRQTHGFVAESERFVSTHLGAYPEAPAWILESSTLGGSRIDSVLDVGCGPGTFLNSVVDRFEASVGTGVEPSSEAVRLLDEKYVADSRLRFVVASAESLPFETDSQDLVFCWSVLHWLGRNEYLQTLGELVRVTRKYLVVMDFVPGRPYRVPYHHDLRYFTYKNDFLPIILGSGIMRLQEDLRWSDAGPPGAMAAFGESALEPFLGNVLNYHGRRGCIFVKDYEALPEFDAADFGE